MTRKPAPRIAIEESTIDSARVLVARGTLDSLSYLQIRDTIIKAALDETAAVIVGVDDLTVPAPSAWSVFTSARWHVSTWPDVPIALSCNNSAKRTVISRNGVTRYVPVYDNIEAAVAATATTSHLFRRRARANLPAADNSIVLARSLTTAWLTMWTMESVIALARIVVTVLVENVLRHTASAPVLLIESRGDTVVVAVQDCSIDLPCRHEGAPDRIGGLAILEAVARLWGTTPTATGKTVWAVLEAKSSG